MLFPIPFVVFFFMFSFPAKRAGIGNLRFFIWFFVWDWIFEETGWSELNSLLRYYVSPPISNVPLHTRYLYPA